MDNKLHGLLFFISGVLAIISIRQATQREEPHYGIQFTDLLDRMILCDELHDHFASGVAGF